MQAMIMREFGGPEVLESAEVSRPRLDDDEVLIRVQAAGVNPVDCKMRSGDYASDDIDLPTVLGREVAGHVEAVGPKVREVYPGEKVYAFIASHGGGYAEFAVANESEVAAMPPCLDALSAAAVPLAATTAWQALFDHGRLKPGQRVLIHGAAGGVGHFAVQFARTREAEVCATARGEDAGLLQELGCTEVINYRRERFEERVRDVDLVIDLIGGETQERSWAVLKPGGILVSTVGQPPAHHAQLAEATGVGFLADPRCQQLSDIGILLDVGAVRVVLQKALPLREAARAHHLLEHDHTVGKIVLAVA